jgi:hypothetical protein
MSSPTSAKDEAFTDAAKLCTGFCMICGGGLIEKKLKAFCTKCGALCQTCCDIEVSM